MCSWEQRKLGDFTNQINTFVNPEDAKLPLWSLTAEAGLIEKSDRYERDFLVKKKDQFKRIETNTLVYNPMNITIGSIDIYTGLYPIAVSGYYVSIVYDKNIDTDFLKEVLLLPSSLKMYKNYATGSLIERQRVQYPTFSKLQLLLPNLDEQKAIGQLFKSLNLNITLHQRKLEHLNLKKKALLQKLFPKNGAPYPELRFPGFTDAWEQRQLGECMNSFAYGLNAAAKNYDGMHKYIRITDIDDETHNFIQSNLTSPDIDFNMDVSDYKLNVGDIVFARTGASVGKTYLYNPNDGDLYYAGFLIRGKVKEDCDAGFIYQNTLTKEYDSFIRITSQRSGQPGVNSKEYATFRLNIPCKDEQEKISKILNCLDELFTLHQQEPFLCGNSVNSGVKLC